MRLQKVDPAVLTPEVLSVFGTSNALLTAGDRSKCNTMTIGWCGLGRIWNVPACTVYVRPERYTYEFMERCGYFTVSVLPKAMKSTVLAYCGTRSGRDVDKFKECGLTVEYGEGDAPYIAGAEWAVVCRKLYAQDMVPAAVCPAGEEVVLPSYGAMGGWHRMYIGQVVEAYQKG